MQHVCGIFDFIDNEIINDFRDIDWERWVRSQTNAPYGIPRYETREDAYNAYQTIPSRNTSCVIDNYTFMQNVILKFVVSQIGEEERIKKLERTFEYIWNILRCGILVCIKNERVVCFCPFYNPNYENSWSNYVDIDKEITDKIKLNKKNWWCNGGIICEEFYPWGIHFNMQLKDMISEVASNKKIQNAIFFINKRDYPQYKYNIFHNKLVEPYGFLYDANDLNELEDLPLSMDININELLPMFSFYGGERFLDRLIPTTEDYESITKRVYLPNFLYIPQLTRNGIRDLTNAIPKTIEPLCNKKGIALFRGSATGSGCTPLTNQRLRLFSLSQIWSDENIDAKCTSLNNKRLRKHYSETFGYIDVGTINFPVSETFYMSMEEQRQYRYLIYVEGHCAACRLGMMLGSGCVILKVKSSCIAPELWYSNLLEENVHYISVREDLTDLREQIHFLEENQEYAQQIANNARIFYETYLGHENLLNYFGANIILSLENN